MAGCSQMWPNPAKNVMVCTAFILLFLLAEADKPGPCFVPIDLREVANADPLSKEGLFHPGVEHPPQAYQWIEGERFNKHQGDFGPEPRARAADGTVLGGGWGKRAGDWAEWYFDLPWQSDSGQLYLRIARGGHNPFAYLVIALDGRDIAGARIPITGGWGDADKDFEIGLCRVKLGKVPMGRHVLRISTVNDGDVLNLDGFWLSDGQQDLINRIGENSRIMPPASPDMLVYPPGRVTIRNMAFDLIDPAHNDRKAVYMSTTRPLVLPCESAQGSRVHLLMAGVDEKVEIRVRVRYLDGRAESTSIEAGELFTRHPKGPAVTFGKDRYGYLASFPIRLKPLREIRLVSSTGRYVLVGAIIEAEGMS